MTQVIATANARGEEISVEGPSWGVPLRHIRIIVDGTELTAWRGYWEQSRTVTTPQGSKVTAGVVHFGLAQKAIIKIDGQEVTSAYAPPAREITYVWHGLATGCLFGCMYGLAQYVIEDISVSRAAVYALSGGAAFAILTTAWARLEQWRFERKRKS